MDLSTLSKEHTHKLEVPVEDGGGKLMMLVTLTASAAVSISDLPVNMLDDPCERKQILSRYVSDTPRLGQQLLVCDSAHDWNLCTYINNGHTTHR